MDQEILVKVEDRNGIDSRKRIERVGQNNLFFFLDIFTLSLSTLCIHNDVENGTYYPPSSSSLSSFSLFLTNLIEWFLSRARVRPIQ